jgi:hypothetical protein
LPPRFSKAGRAESKPTAPGMVHNLITINWRNGMTTPNAIVFLSPKRAHLKLSKASPWQFSAECRTASCGSGKMLNEQFVAMLFSKIFEKEE